MMKSMLCALALCAALAATGASAADAAHTAAGPHAALACDTCHANGKMTAPDKQTCLGCHGSYEQVAERTASLKPNPHASHRGEPNCTNCHSMHGKSRLECNDCHTFSLKMKGE